MPICRHCGVRISKFDKDRCPICGELEPLKDVKSDTIEVTSEIDINERDLLFKYKPRKRTTLLLLSMLLGWTGAPFFYLYYKKMGFIWLLANLIIFAGAFSAFYFPSLLNLPLSIIIPLGVLYISNITLGLIIFFRKNVKDKNNNLLR